MENVQKEENCFGRKYSQNEVCEIEKMLKKFLEHCTFSQKGP